MWIFWMTESGSVFFIIVQSECCTIHTIAKVVKFTSITLVYSIPLQWLGVVVALIQVLVQLVLL